MDNDNIAQEIKFLELFGYNYIKGENGNKWIIEDENHNEVGLVQLEKGINKVTKEDEYSYHTKIDSELITCDFFRNRASEDDYGNYVFKVKRKNDKTDEVFLRLGKYSRFYMESEEYGPLQLNVFRKGIHLDFNSRTDNYYFREILTYYNNPEEQEYSYEIKYCDSEISSRDEMDKYIKIRGSYIKNMNKPNEILIEEEEKRDNEEKRYKKEIVKGTVEELAKKHGMGIRSIEHFRYLISNLIPTKQDLFSIMISQDVINELNLSVLFPKLEESKKKVKKT